jgi:CRISPR/Cas system-associated endoribonuclease Cas2
MAQIDPSIALGFRMPQIQDPVAATARVQEIGVNALKMQELQRGLQEEQEIRNYLAGADLAKPETRAGLAKFGKAGLATGKLLAEQERAGLETKKLSGEIDKQRLEQSRERTSNLAFNPSNENILAHLQDSVLRGEMNDNQAQGLWSQVKDLNPNQRKQTFLQLGASAAKRLEQMTLSEYQRQNLGLQAEGQRLQYAPDVVANTVTDAAGNVTQFNRFGQVIGKPGAVGKPSATFEKTAALQKQTGRDLDLAIKELTEATKDKGLIDQSTGSGAGRLVDVAAGFAGQATPGAIAIAKLKPIADMTLKMVPRFEGPQSDKDTQSYKEAAGQLADPSLPTEIRKQAGKEVLRLMKARKGQFVNEAMAAEGIGASGVDTSNPLLK